MTVNELMEKLKDMPKDAEVLIFEKYECVSRGIDDVSINEYNEVTIK